MRVVRGSNERNRRLAWVLGPSSVVALAMLAVALRSPPRGAPGELDTHPREPAAEHRRPVRVAPRESQPVPSRRHRGVVQSEDGRPVPNARVCALRNEALLARSGACVTASRQGRFELVTGEETHALFVMAPGFLCVEQPLPVEVGNRADSEIQIVLRAGAVQVAGWVSDAAGGRVAGAHLVVTSRDASSLLAIAESDARGAFQLWVKAQRVQLSAFADGYSSEVLEVDPPASNVTLVMAPAAGISGVVVPEDRLAAAALVTATLTQRASPPRTVPVSSDGSFRFEELPPGTYSVVATSAQARSFSTSVEVWAGQVSEGVIVELHQGSTLAASLTVAGRPCSDGSIAAVGPIATTAQTVSPGVVEVAGLLPGQYQLTARCAGAIPEQRASAIAREDQELSWDLREGLTVSGRVQDDAGNALPGLGVSMRAASTPREVIECASDARGDFSCGGLRADRWTASAAGGGGTELDVTSGSLRDVVLVVGAPGAGVIRVSVAQPGAERPGLAVFARREGSFHALAARRAGDVHLIEGLDWGAYSVETLTARAVKVVLDRTHPSADVQLEVTSPRVLTGQILDTRQVPVPDAWVVATPSAFRQGLPVVASPAVLSDGDGRFEIDNVLDTEHEVEVTTPGSKATALASPGSAPLVITLPESGRFSVALRSADGTIVPGFQLTYAGTDGIGVTEPSTEGRWLSPWLPVGTYRVHAHSLPGDAEAEMVLRAGEGSRLELVVSERALEASAGHGYDGAPTSAAPGSESEGSIE